MGKQQKSLFEHPEVLEESDTDLELLPFQNVESERFREKLVQWRKFGKHRIIAYIGLFGSGKSVILDNIKGHGNYYWVKFDTWRYSSRQQIWDGFVVEIIQKLEHGTNQEISDAIKVANRIEGHHTNKNFLKLHGCIQKHPWLSISLVSGLWLAASLAVYSWIAPLDNGVANFVVALFQYGLTPLFLVLAFIGLDSIVPKPQRPLRRVFELENELFKTLKENMDKPLIVIAEDVDRAQEEGLVFLEVLRRFLQKHGDNIPHPVLIIAPQSRAYFDILDNRGVGGFERALKIYDETIYSSASNLETNHVKDLINSATINSNASQLTEVVINLVDKYKNQLSMRLLKLILRELNQFMHSHPNEHPVIVLVLVFSRYVIDERRSNSSEGFKEVNKLLQEERNVHISEDTGRTAPYAVFIKELHKLAKEELDGRTFKLEFADIKGEVEIKYDTNQKNDIIRTNLKINNKYKILIQ